MYTLTLVRAEEHSKATGLGTDLEATIAQLERSQALKVTHEESRIGDLYGMTYYPALLYVIRYKSKAGRIGAGGI
jgi:hypothetical protein